MKIFGISDLHLSFGSDKPMDIFGDQWKDHAGQIEENWRAVITDEDWVLMGGDLSWALKMPEVIPDLEFVHALPGQKLMIKGNHAHWWSSRKKVDAILPDSIRVMQNDSFVLPDGTGIVGTRGWNPPGRNEGGRPYSEKDQKVYDREVGRLKLSIQDLSTKEYKRVWAMIHYPPVYSFGLVTEYVAFLEELGVELCLYGHLHGRDHASGFVGDRNGIRYVMASVDYTNFCPVLLGDGLEG